MVNDVTVFKLRRKRKEEAVVITSTHTGQFELINQSLM